MTVRQIGTHVAGFENPDTLVWRLNGSVTHADALALDAFNRNWVKAKYLLVDLSRKIRFEADARQHWSSDVDLESKIITVAFGTASAVRIVAQLIVSSLNATVTRGKGLEVSFVDTEEQARAWVQSHRSVGSKKGRSMLRFSR